MTERPAMTASSSAADLQDIQRRRGRWVPWCFVLFFAVIALLDGIFVTIAIRTHTGVVTEDAYEKGLAFNQVLDSAARQAHLGLRQKAAFEDGVLSWTLTDGQGMPLPDARVHATFYRPTQAGYDFTLPLDGAGRGVYRAQPQFPLPGLWTARLEAQWTDPSQQGTQTFRTSLDLVTR